MTSWSSGGNGPSSVMPGIGLGSLICGNPISASPRRLRPKALLNFDAEGGCNYSAL